MKYEIHVSDMKAFLECRRKWNWSSILRGNLERKMVYAPFFTGRLVHYCLQVYYEQGILPSESLPRWVNQEVSKMATVGPLWPVEQDTIDEQVSLAEGILDHYVMWARSERGPWADRNLEFIALETEFSVPLRTANGRSSPKVYLGGRFDGLVRRKDNGTFWLLETKTTRSVKELLDSLENEFQPGVYIYATRELMGWPVSGVLYNILRKKVPTTPRLLNNGMLSQDKRIDTTAVHYLQAIREAHPDLDEDEITALYGDMLNHLMSDMENPFFARVAIRRTPKEIDQLAEDVWRIALDMTKPNIHIYPYPDWFKCKRCAFRAPCLAMNAGVDYELILQSEYRTRGTWDVEEADYANELTNS